MSGKCLVKIVLPWRICHSFRWCHMLVLSLLSPLLKAQGLGAAMKQFRLIPFALMAVGLALPAYAADMPMLKAPPVAVAVSDWSGVLIGTGFGSRSVKD